MAFQSDGGSWTGHMDVRDGDGGVIYAVDREVDVAEGAAHVVDTVTNLTNGDLGMFVEHDLGFADAGLATVYLGGDGNPVAFGAKNPFNPTVFVPLGGVGVGLTVDDDAFRQQSNLLALDRDSAFGPTHRVGMNTLRLDVPAGASHAMRWSIYALPSSDYFDFVNRVRTDWNVMTPNTPIPGPYVFANPVETFAEDPGDAGAGAPDAAFSNWVAHAQQSPPYAFVFGTWTNLGIVPRPQGLGVEITGPTFANYRAELRDEVAKIRALTPGVKILVYVHMFYDSPLVDGGDGYPPSEWITLAVVGRYVDSFGGRFAQAGGILPTSDSGTAPDFGADFRAMLDALLASGGDPGLGVDGFYIDETAYPGNLASDPVTHNAWDGVSALVDPATFAVQSRVGSIPLLAQSYQDDLFGSLRARGVPLLGNFPPVTRAAGQASWPRFVETENAIAQTSYSHLYTPVVFSSFTQSYAMHDVRDRLDFGGLWVVTGFGDGLNLADHFFPLTVRGIHGGWIAGDERIITSRSGSFGWRGGTYEVRTWTYDRSGALLDASPPWVPATGASAIDVPPDGIVVLERR
jgi:hypothetical protein